MNASSTPTPPVRQVSEAERAQLATADALLPGGALGGYGLSKDVRFVAAQAQGSRIEDASGNSYIDYVLGAGAMFLGHAHPAVSAALHRQVDRGTHFFSILNDNVLPLAEEVVAAIPGAETVTFTSTGSEATAYALRFARAFTKRDKILKFEGAYHGNHDYSLVSSAPTRLANYPHGTTDTGGIPASLVNEILVAPYNDLEAVRSIVADHKDQLAAIIVEPIQRIISPAPGFLQGLREICDANGIVLIFDEVVTGFRLAYGGAQEYFGVTPDLAAYGKILGGGLALGAVAGRADIIALSDPAKKGSADFAYVNGTLHGNPLASAAGLATLRELKARNAYGAVNAFTGELRKELGKRLEAHGIPAVIVGEAALWHVLFTGKAPKNHADVMAADAKALRAFDELLIKNGVFVLPGVRRLMSLAHDQADFDQTVAAFDRACSAYK